MLAIGTVFSLAYSGLGVSLALKTASNQAVQLSFLLFFPLIFLSLAFAPKEVFSGWLEFLATINPITYVLEGCRSLVLEGWDAAALAPPAWLSVPPKTAPYPLRLGLASRIKRHARGNPSREWRTSGSFTPVPRWSQAKSDSHSRTQNSQWYT